MAIYPSYWYFFYGLSNSVQLYMEVNNDENMKVNATSHDIKKIFLKRHQCQND
jgi:hypothetical protein